jgi:hypothetical protein
MWNWVDLTRQLGWTNLLRDRTKQTRVKDTKNFVVCMDRRVTTMYLHPVSPLCMSTLYHQLALTAWRSRSSPTHLPNTKIILRGPWVSAINLRPPPHELAENRRQNSFRRHLICSYPPPPAVPLCKPCIYHEVLRGLPLPDLKEFVQILKWSAIHRVFRFLFVSIVTKLGVYRGLIFLQYSVQAKFVSSLLEMAPRRYPYFGVVAGLVWSNDPKSYAGSSVCYW